MVGDGVYESFGMPAVHGEPLTVRFLRGAFGTPDELRIAGHNGEAPQKLCGAEQYRGRLAREAAASDEEACTSQRMTVTRLRDIASTQDLRTEMAHVLQETQPQLRISGRCTAAHRNGAKRLGDCAKPLGGRV